ncbi:MAG: cupin domain-containing protein [Thermoleophilaceae bacterium]|nr:cupin domain-containing protein [Thermoleophilaceae bacterium]
MSETIAGVTHMPIEEMEAIWRGSYRRARGSLGVQAFGLGVMDLPPNFDRIPRHVHTFDGQEEVYIPLKGSGWIDVGAERVHIDPGVAVRVGPTASRTLISGPDGLQVLIVGGTPGQAYEPFAPLELGAPEPDPSGLPGIRATEGYESTEDYLAVPIEGCGALTGVFEGVTLYPLGRALGVTSFGLNELDVQPHGGNDSAYPRHMHEEDRQQEVYVIARGSGVVEVDDDRIELTEGEMVSIEPDVVRKWHAGDDGVRIIAIGAPAGEPYASNKPTIV